MNTDSTVMYYDEQLKQTYVDLELVSFPKSPLSIKAVDKPLVVASKAAPAPVAPPPTTNTSNSILFWLADTNVDIWSDLDGTIVFLAGVDADVARSVSFDVNSSDFFEST